MSTTRFSNLSSSDFAREVIRSTSEVELDNPFYVLDIDDLYGKVELWHKSLPRVKPFYAVKCNDHPTVLKVLESAGLGFDCASVVEIETMLRLGVSPSRIIYAHPQKHVSSVQRARDLGVDLMTFDSAEELNKVSEHFPNARLVLRLKVDNKKAWFAMGDKFGCNPRESFQLLHMAKDLNLSVVGICFHVGSSNQDPDAFSGAIANARRAYDLATSLGFNITLLDIGGGYPGEKGTKEIFLKTADIISENLDHYFPPEMDIAIISEPGTFFVASAFTLYAKVIGKRINEAENNTKAKEIMYYINESVYKSFVVSLFNDDPVDPQPLLENDATKEQSIIWGITCDGLDKIKGSCMLPELSVGDWLMFESMGAYTITLNTPFNGFPSADVLYRASKMTEEDLRKRELLIEIVDCAS
ncbi:antizyme inhibitor 2-like [Ornithodoros turicata]|uniref:antizyme inhibitor 2-like n=1 Tax=Ornithodoros turicata TaxID=34597 RepID=UPI0031389224